MMSIFPDLADKSVVITGGSKGIGKEIALSFAKSGANVVIIGRNQEALEETVDELKQYHANCDFVAADLNETQKVPKVIEKAVQQMGGLDILVNNAGINIAKPALEVEESDWDRVLDTNLKASFFCSQQAAKYMKDNGGGRIINIASQMSFVGYWDRAAYCSSKGGIVQLTKALAIEWANFNINVNAVAPTFIETELTENMFKDEAFKEDVFRRIPLGRLADSSDVAGAVLYLASQLAKSITGETIRVDGGWTAI